MSSRWSWDLEDLHCRPNGAGAPHAADRLRGWWIRAQAARQEALEQERERQARAKRADWRSGGIRVHEGMMKHPWYGLLTLHCYNGGTPEEIANLLTRSKV
jgi:hypothetical protein